MHINILIWGSPQFQLSYFINTKRSNQSILKEINPEHSLEGLMLKWKFQWFGHLMQRADSLEKTPVLGKIGGQTWRAWQRMIDSITDSMDMNFCKFWEKVKAGKSGVLLRSMRSQKVIEELAIQQQQFHKLYSCFNLPNQFLNTWKSKKERKKEKKKETNTWRKITG